MEHIIKHDKAVHLLDAVKELGFYPKETKATDDAGKNECHLAYKIRKARKNQLFTAAQEMELEQLRQTSVHPRDRALLAKLLAEAQEPCNPMEGVATESKDLLLLQDKADA